MPLPFFQRSPQPSERTSHFSAIQDNVRSLLGGSSIYSNSPVISSHESSPSTQTSRSFPKLPVLEFTRRPSTPLDTTHLEHQHGIINSPIISPRHMLPQHTAGSYQRAINPESPAERRNEQYLVTPPILAQSPISESREEPTQYPVGEQTEVTPRRPRRKRPRDRVRLVPKPRTRPAWVKRRGVRSSNGNDTSLRVKLRSRVAKRKLLAVTISAVFLAVVLTIYLCIYLLHPFVGQEIHILFILVIICTTVFFCHALVRLCMVITRPPSDTPRMPNMSHAAGFRPVKPIRVHLARDEEYMDTIDEEQPAAVTEEHIHKETKGPKIPPPAYGLWRSSMRVDPNLLHWQRVGGADGVDERTANELGIGPPQRSPASPHSPLDSSVERIAPRPPSYASEDGVAYVVSAVPRSMAPPPGVIEVHPAYRHPAD